MKIALLGISQGLALNLSKYLNSILIYPSLNSFKVVSLKECILL